MCVCVCVCVCLCVYEHTKCNNSDAFKLETEHNTPNEKQETLEQTTSTGPTVISWIQFFKTATGRINQICGPYMVWYCLFAYPLILVRQQYDTSSLKISLSFCTYS